MNPHIKPWLAWPAMIAVVLGSVIFPLNAPPASAASPLVASSAWPICTSGAATVLADSGNGFISGQWTSAYYAQSGTPSTPGGVVRLSAPCRPTSTTLFAGVNAVRWSSGVGSYGTEATAGNVSILWTCSTSSTATTGVTISDTSTSEGGTSQSAGVWGTKFHNVGNLTVANCPYVVSFSIAYTVWQPGGTAMRLAATWTGASYLTTGYVPSVGVPTGEGQTQVGGPGYETPLTCSIAIDNTDILTVMSSFFTGIPGWVSCLFVPQGWDRGGRVTPAWNASGVSRTGQIVSAVLPGAGNVVCGNVLDLNIPPLVMQITTCTVASIVPSWIKVGVASVVIIGLLLLFLRRVQWTVTK